MLTQDAYNDMLNELLRIKREHAVLLDFVKDVAGQSPSEDLQEYRRTARGLLKWLEEKR